MNMVKCDGGCNKISPDEHGMHIANGWLYIEVTDNKCAGRFGPRVEKFRLCEECATGFAPDKRLSMLSKIAESVKYYFYQNST